MGRRLIGGALVAVGLIAASLAWAGFAASRTVLDPSRSEAIATDIYGDREVRAQLRSSMASALDAAIPEGVQVSRAELVAAADRALDDPAVEALLVGGLIRAHQRFLGEDPNPDSPIVIDGAAMARASRSALVNLRPELVNVVPEPPSLPVELPTEQLPDASGLRTWLNATVAMLAAVAVGLVVAAFVLTNDRPRVMRRVGFWAIGASVFWLLVGVVLPELAHLLLPGAAAILAAMWGVAAGGMIEPSRTALLAGVGAVVASFLWAGVAALVGGGREARVRPDPRRAGTSTRRTTTVAPTARPATVGAGVGQVGASAPAGYSSGDASATAAANATATPAGGRPMRTPGPITPPQGSPVVPGAPFPAPPQQAAAPRWVEGVGYVDDPDATHPG